MVLKSSPATLWRQMSKIALGLLREAVVCACHSGPSGCVRSLAAPAGPKAIAAFCLSHPRRLTQVHSGRALAPFYSRNVCSLFNSVMS